MVERVDAGVGRILATLERLGSDAQHDRHLHQRQRRRMAVARRPALPSQGVGVGRRHPRAGAGALAGAGFPPARVSRQVGITMDLTATILAAAPASGYPRTRSSTASTCCPILEGRAPERPSGRCSGGSTACGAPAAGRPRAATGSWSSTRVVRCSSTCPRDIGERTDVIDEHVGRRARACRPRSTAWQARRRRRSQEARGTRLRPMTTRCTRLRAVVLLALVPAIAVAESPAIATR